MAIVPALVASPRDTSRDDGPAQGADTDDWTSMHLDATPDTPHEQGFPANTSPATLRPRRVAATAVTLAVISYAAMIIWLTVVLPWHLDGLGDWWGTSWDLWMGLPAGRYIANGALLYIYDAPFNTQIGGYAYPPLFPVLLAPFVAIGDALQLTDATAYPVSKPTMTFPLGAGIIVPAVTAVTYTVRSSLHRVGRHVGAHAQIAAAVVAFPALYYWHGEDLLIVALAFVAVAAIVDERWTTAAVAVATAVLLKQWAVVLIPVVVFAAPKAYRLKTVLISVVAPVAVMVPFLLATPDETVRSFTSVRTVVTLSQNQLWLPIVYGDAGTVNGTAPRIVWIGACIAATYLWRRRRDPAQMFAGVGALFLARCLFEPALFSYYWVPAALMAVAVAAATGRSTLRVVVLSTMLATWHAIHITPLGWWAVTAILAALLWAPMVRLAFATIVPPDDPHIADDTADSVDTDSEHHGLNDDTPDAGLRHADDSHTAPATHH